MLGWLDVSMIEAAIHAYPTLSGSVKAAATQLSDA
jgi:hypothetical protein